MIRRPPRSTRTDTLVPYTTLFRSVAAAGIGLDHLQHGADVLLHRQAAEDRRLLRQVADPEPGAAVHRQAGYVVPDQRDRAGIGRDPAGDDVAAGGLDGAVGAEPADCLAASATHRDSAQHPPALDAPAEVAGAAPSPTRPPGPTET